MTASLRLTPPDRAPSPFLIAADLDPSGGLSFKVTAPATLSSIMGAPELARLVAGLLSCAQGMPCEGSPAMTAAGDLRSARLVAEGGGLVLHLGSGAVGLAFSIAPEMVSALAADAAALSIGS